MSGEQKEGALEVRSLKGNIVIVTSALAMGIAGVVGNPQTTRAAGDPYHAAEVVWCYGAANRTPSWDFIRVDAPVVYAYNYRPGVEDTQYYRWQAHLMKSVNGIWVYTNRSTGLSTWSLTADGEGVWRPFYDAANRRAALDLYIPERGFEYQVWVDIQWAKSGTVPYAFWRRILPRVHLDGGGDGWLAGDPHGRNDPNVCDYIPDVGYINM